MVTTDELWYTTAKGKSMNISEIAKLAGVSSAAVSVILITDIFRKKRKKQFARL